MCLLFAYFIRETGDLTDHSDPVGEKDMAKFWVQFSQTSSLSGLEKSCYPFIQVRPSDPRSANSGRQTDARPAADPRSTDGKSVSDLRSTVNVFLSKSVPPWLGCGHM